VEERLLGVKLDSVYSNHARRRRNVLATAQAKGPHTDFYWQTARKRNCQ